MRRRRSTPRRQPQPGFTLIELLVVIVILALLIGMLIPAVMRAVGRAREATVAAEIQAMGQALADFKGKYGEYPPSRILIVENGNYSTSNPLIGAQLAPLIPRSIAALRRYWPRMAISTSGSAPSGIPGKWYDVKAFAKHPKAFDRLYCNMIKAGEAGGALEAILQRLADFKEKAQSLKRRIKSAMVYPIVVIFVACVIVGFILYFIIPKFEAIFKDFGVPLPGMTIFLIEASHFLIKYFYLVFLAPLFLWIFIKLLYRNRTGAYICDRILLMIPVMGAIVEKSTVARTTRTLGTLVQSGVPILESLSIVRDTAGNAVFERAFTRIYESIREGETIAQPLRESRIVDDIVVNMIDVGEETGDLDTMLNKIADNYDEEVEALVESLVSLLEPMMIVVLGGIIGFIVIALFLPLITLITKLSG